MSEREELLIAAEEFLRVKYVARADSRQRSMGLAYIEAERSDLAKEICNFIERRGLLNPTSQPPPTQHSPPPLCPSHNSGERLPSSDAAVGGGETISSAIRGTP